MPKIYDICEIREKQIKVAKLRQIFGELFDCVAIPPPGVVLKEMVYILPASFLRRINDLSLSEIDDLLNDNLGFFIVENL